MGIDRNTIEAKYKWQIDKMYSTKEAIEKDIEKVKQFVNDNLQVKETLTASIGPIMGTFTAEGAILIAVL